MTEEFTELTPFGYKDKWVVIVGPTKPWKEHIKQIGTCNFIKNIDLGNGKKTGGWKFGKESTAAVLEFIRKVKTGELSLTQPLTASFASSTTSSSSTINLGFDPATCSSVHTEPTTLTFPNQFKGPDGIQYQILMFTVPLPALGQRVEIICEDHQINTISCVVQNVINSQQAVVSRTSSGEDREGHEESDGNEDIYSTNEYEINVIGGQWQVREFLNKDDYGHIVKFL